MRSPEDGSRTQMTVSGCLRRGPLPFWSFWEVGTYNGHVCFASVVSTGRRNTLSSRRDGVYGDGSRISSRVYCGREDGAMGSLEARRVAEGDRASVWQAVIVDLFFGGSAWWDSSCPAAALQAGIDACGTRGDFQRHYGTSIGALDG